MRLSARIVKNYINNNNFDYTENINIRGGEPTTFWIQLVDLDKKDHLRYIPCFPTSVLSMTVKFDNIDTCSDQGFGYSSAGRNKAFSVPAVIACVDDKSIWSVYLSGHQVPSSGNIFFNYIENGISYKFYLLDALKVQTLEVGGC
jgi:hypothetical protein